MGQLIVIVRLCASLKVISNAKNDAPNICPQGIMLCIDTMCWLTYCIYQEHFVSIVMHLCLYAAAMIGMGGWHTCQNDVD